MKTEETVLELKHPLTKDIRMYCFVCTGNTCRSPMAAALLRRALDKRGREDILVESAGLAAGAAAPASEYALAAAAEIGLDLSGHLSRPFTPALAAGAARIVAMTAGHAAVLTGRFAVPPRKVIVPSGGIPDPFGGTLADYRRTRDTLAAAMDAERFEWTHMYAEFERVAREEGFDDIAGQFGYAAAVEREHEARFRGLWERLRQGTLFTAPAPRRWRCRNCGYIHTGNAAPEICPLCAHPRGWYEWDAGWCERLE